MTARSEILTSRRNAAELEQGLFARFVLIHGISPHAYSYCDVIQ